MLESTVKIIEVIRTPSGSHRATTSNSKSSFQKVSFSTDRWTPASQNFSIRKFLYFETILDPFTTFPNIFSHRYLSQRYVSISFDESSSRK